LKLKLCSSILGNKLILVLSTILLAASLVIAAGCAAKINPPVIQQSNMPVSIIEGESIDLTVHTTSDTSMKDVYVQFGSGDKIPLAKMTSQNNGHELADWGVVLNLPANDYSYRIVAEDSAGNKSLPLEGKITVTPKNPATDTR
jgi:hypothetical protein